MTPFQKKVKGDFYLQHSCPHWADEKQWLKLLDKVQFTANDKGLEITYKRLTIEEVKILEGFSLASILECRHIHKDERTNLMKYQKLEQVNQELEPKAQKGEKFTKPKPIGLEKKTIQIRDFIKTIYSDSSIKKLHREYERHKPADLPSCAYSTFCRHYNAVKKQI